jgi:hypothetical protein
MATDEHHRLPTRFESPNANMGRKSDSASVEGLTLAPLPATHRINSASIVTDDAGAQTRLEMKPILHTITLTRSTYRSAAAHIALSSPGEVGARCTSDSAPSVLAH